MSNVYQNSANSPLERAVARTAAAAPRFHVPAELCFQSERSKILCFLFIHPSKGCIQIFPANQRIDAASVPLLADSGQWQEL